MNRILIVEDDEITREGIVAYFKHNGYDVYSAKDGKEARVIFDTRNFDLIILDVMLPYEDGLSLLQYFKKRKDVSVIMLTALEDEKTQTVSFDSLADDYVVKPFSLVVLEKRVVAVLRRANTLKGRVWEYESVKIDFNASKAIVNSKEVDLKLKEMQILEYLIQNKNIVLTRDQILNALWEDEYPNDRVIDVYVKNIRKKLKLECIKTVKGLGYIMEFEDENS